MSMKLSELIIYDVQTFFMNYKKFNEFEHNIF